MQGEPESGFEGRPVETEGKWRLDADGGPDRLRARLHELGADRIGVEDEVNFIYDAPDGHLLGSGRLLRIRTVNGGRAGLLTVKGPASYARRIKSRPELETTVADAQTTRSMLELLGYEVAVEYPKTRESWRLGSLHVAVDQLPFGWYCEIEGTIETIEAAARQLGLSHPEQRGYPTLMSEHLARR